MNELSRLLPNGACVRSRRSEYPYGSEGPVSRQARGRLGLGDCRIAVTPASLSPASVDRSASLLLRLDLALVRILVASAHPSLIRSSAVWISRLGNGALYAVLPVLVLGHLGRSGLRVVLVSICSVALLHCVYPYVKRRVERPRPFQIEPALGSPLAVLDEYSFPSGHVMTLTATLVPIMYVTPGSTVPGTVLLAGMAWARVATAHHYASDVGAGAFFGGLFSYAMSVEFLQSA
jgi:undecaprenyl-diphosphatase